MSNLTLPEELREIACTIDCEHHERILREAAPLCQFAELVLDLLQSHLEWNADTLDAIGGYAHDMGLSEQNEFGEFRRKLSNPAISPE